MTTKWFCNTLCHYRCLYCNTLPSFAYFTKKNEYWIHFQFCFPSIADLTVESQFLNVIQSGSLLLSIPPPSFPTSGSASIPFPSSPPFPLTGAKCHHLFFGF